MKNLLFLLPLLFLLLSCAEEPDLVLFSPQSFAFSMDDGWEVNASVNAKGFAQIEKDNSDLYFTQINYLVNLYSPEDTIFNADYDSIIDSTNEEVLDIQIESQLQLDSGFKAGEYKIEFIVVDEYSQTRDTLSTNFILE
jgi:hypothetical protein